MPNCDIHFAQKSIENSKNECTDNGRRNHPHKSALQPLPRALVLVALVIEHGEGDDEEGKDGIGDINNEPKGLHRKGKAAGAIVDGIAASLTIGDIGREHENGDSGDGEAKNDDELRKVSLVGIVRVLVVDEDVEIHKENEDAHHHGDDHQGEIEIVHF